LDTNICVSQEIYLVLGHLFSSERLSSAQLQFNWRG